ncbi:Uncharacterised protein [Mycobacterium tuberculosis]|nr:Uncharacterised protein [Mycobacterium tuberculosis]
MPGRFIAVVRQPSLQAAQIPAGQGGGLQRAKANLVEHMRGPGGGLLGTGGTDTAP